MVDGVEKRPDVHIEHPAHLLRRESDVERVQRVMLATPGPESVGEPEEVGLVDGVQHLDRGPLDDFVFQHGHAERPLPPVSLRDVHPPNRFRSIRPSLQPLREVLEIHLQSLFVVLPRLAVHARDSIPLQRKECCPQARDVVHVVQERGEPHLPIPFCRLPYPLQRTWRVSPARCPGRVLLAQVSFGQPPSLRRLLCQSIGVVRRLRRYYGAVRLPGVVRHRRTPFGFPTRSAGPSPADNSRTSRFPRMVFPSVHRVSDRAGSWHVSR